MAKVSKRRKKRRDWSAIRRGSRPYYDLTQRVIDLYGDSLHYRRLEEALVSALYDLFAEATRTRVRVRHIGSMLITPVLGGGIKMRWCSGLNDYLKRAFEGAAFIEDEGDALTGDDEDAS